MRKILVFNRHFYPSYKSGGPVRTLTAMIERLRELFAFSIVTGDTEYGAEDSYAGIEVNSWNLVCQIKCNVLGHPDEAYLKKLPEEFSNQDTFAVYH